MTTRYGHTDEDTARTGRARHGRPDDTPAGAPRHQSPQGGRHGGGPGRTPYQERFGMPAVDASTITVPPQDRTETTGPPSGVTPAAEPARSRRWPLLVLGALAVLLVGVGIGRASVGSPSAAAPPSPAVSVPSVAAPVPGPSSPAPAPAPSRVAIPTVSGQNGAIVAEQLQKLGFTKVQYASRDDADSVVVNPANWTATKIEPRAGTKVATDSTVVVTMTKEN